MWLLIHPLCHLPAEPDHAGARVGELVEFGYEAQKRKVTVMMRYFWIWIVAIPLTALGIAEPRADQRNGPTVQGTLESTVTVEIDESNRDESIIRYIGSGDLDSDLDGDPRLGIQLLVGPTVALDEHIVLEIDASSAVGEFLDVEVKIEPRGGSATTLARARNVVLGPNGRIVLDYDRAGLERFQKMLAEQGLPTLGMLFTKRRVETNERELHVLVRAYIVSPS